MGQIVIHDVSASYGHVHAIRNVNISVEDGQFVVLFGPSGAGKTTLLNVVAGIKSPAQGRILIDGQDVTKWEPWQRDVAMVFENYALYPHRTVYENIASPLVQRKVPANIVEQRVQSIAEMLGIGRLLQRRPAEISNGQKQRVAIGRAMVRDSKVLLMDEPLAHLDAKLRNEMRTELILMKKRIKRTVIYVTHDYREAMALADHLIVIRNGEIAQQGEPESVFKRPESTHVARLLGNPPRNLISMEVMRGGITENIVPLQWLPWDLRCQMHVSDLSASQPDQITMGVLGRNLKLVANSDPQDENSCRFRVPIRLVEQQGAFAMVTVGDADREVQFRCDPYQAEELEIGDTVEVEMQLGETLLYDPAGSLLNGHRVVALTAKRQEA